MHIAQSVVLSVVDNDGVSVRNIESRLNNCCRNKHIVFPLHKIEHNLLQSLPVHLAVSRDDTRLRHQPLYCSGNVGQLLNAVIDKENLSAAVEFVADGLFQDALVVGVNLGEHGLAVGRWRADDR